MTADISTPDILIITKLFESTIAYLLLCQLTWTRGQTKEWLDHFRGKHAIFLPQIEHTNDLGL